MHKKLGSLIAIACLSASLAVAQSGTRPASEQVTSVSWGLQNPPLPVASGSVALVGGQPGNATYYFWVVANYLIGSAPPAGPFLLANGRGLFAAPNYANLSWAAAPGAISYDILLTTAPSQPTGACGCAVATGVANTSVQVQTNSLNAYTVTAVDVSAYTIGSQNVQSGLGISALQFTRPDGTIIGSLDTTGELTVNRCVGCGGGSGRLTNTIDVTANTISDLPNNGSDMCAAWTALLAGAPADAIFYVPDGVYYTTCSGGNNVSQSAHFVCQSPGVLNSGKTAIVGGAVFKQQIAFNNAPGSVENCGFDTIASGLAGGTSNNGVVSNGTAGNMTVSGNQYVGCNGTAGCNAAHAYVMQGGPHNRLTNNSAYYAYHCAASRSSDTIVDGLYCFDPADVVLKSDTSTGNVNANHFSNITIEMDTTSPTPYGSGVFEVNANNSTQVSASDVVNLKCINSPYCIDIDPETGGIITGINFNSVVGSTVGLGIILQTTTTGSVTEVHLDNSSFTNSAAFTGFNRSIATPSFYTANTSFKSGTTNGVTNAGIVHASFMPTGTDAWDQMEPHPEIETQVNNTATAGHRYQAPNGVGVNMEAAVQTFGIVT